MNSRLNSKGFSLPEMMMSVLIISIVSASVLHVMTTYQKTYRSAQMMEEMRASVRGAVVLMGQEIGQAGLLTSPVPDKIDSKVRTLKTKITATGVQSVTISSTSHLFTGQKLAVDLGTSREVVTLMQIVDSHTITANFTSKHDQDVLIDASGLFPTGILTTAAGTTLQLYGDLDGDSRIYFVEYACDLDGGVLTRSITDIDGVASKNPAAVMVRHVVANPDGSPCFQPVTTTLAGKTYVTSVGVTISIQGAAPDPLTGKYVTMTKSVLNLSPRNVLAALDLLAQSPVPERIQPTPPNLPLN